MHGQLDLKNMPRLKSKPTEFQKKLSSNQTLNALVSHSVTSGACRLQPLEFVLGTCASWVHVEQAIHAGYTSALPTFKAVKT